FLISFFGLHFIYQFMYQEAPYNSIELPLTLEQWMSIPMILTGIFLLIYIYSQRKRHHSPQNDARPITQS
ncbi:MAG: hypothetical protein ACOCWM_02550, partial [Cyclobacteriaceae bacterium]